jgi:hypothetical protein
MGMADRLTEFGLFDERIECQGRFGSSMPVPSAWVVRVATLFDPTFGRKLLVLFERCGLESIRHEATAEAVRGVVRGRDGGRRHLRAFTNGNNLNVA